MTSNRSNSATEQIIATGQILKGKLTNHSVCIMFFFHLNFAINFIMGNEIKHNTDTMVS